MTTNNTEAELSAKQILLSIDADNQINLGISDNINAAETIGLMAIGLFQFMNNFLNKEKDQALFSHLNSVNEKASFLSTQVEKVAELISNIPPNENQIPNSHKLEKENKLIKVIEESLKELKMR